MAIVSNSIAILMLIVVLVVFVIIALTSFAHLFMGVPYVPTPMRVVRAMIAAGHVKPGQTVLDLGAGDARLLIETARTVPGIKGIGFEGALGIWFLGKLRIWWAGLPIQFVRKNFFSQDFSSADVVFTYLSVAVMKKLYPKFLAELKPGARVVTHAFRLPVEAVPTEIIDVQMQMGGATKVYAYVF